jgi:hypothetical protein
VKLDDTVKLRTSGAVQVVALLIAPVVVLLAVCAAAGAARVAQPIIVANAATARRQIYRGLLRLAGPAILSA